MVEFMIFRQAPKEFESFWPNAKSCLNDTSPEAFSPSSSKIAPPHLVVFLHLPRSFLPELVLLSLVFVVHSTCNKLSQ